MGDCVIFSGSKNKDGYGRVSYGGRVVLAHRVAYIKHHAVDPGPLSVLHSCDTPSCVNPDHLFLGTQLDNMRDMNKKGRRASSAGEANGRSKLSESDVVAIRRLRKSGVKAATIAEAFFVSRSCIYHVCLLNSWKEII